MSLASSQEAAVSPTLTSARHWTACAVSLPGCRVPGPAAPSLRLQQGRRLALQKAGRQEASLAGRAASHRPLSADQGQTKGRNVDTGSHPATLERKQHHASPTAAQGPPFPGTQAPRPVASSCPALCIRHLKG